MGTWQIIVIAVVAAVLVAAVVVAVLRTRRRRRLQQRFGPEYDHVVHDTERRADAEAELHERLERREALDIRPLSTDERERYRERWRRVQHDFVDAPRDSLTRADALIQDVMRDRGYPVEDFEQRAADLSVDHPEVVTHYRAGHDAVANGSTTGTEEQREAMLHFRSLFAALVTDRDQATEVDVREHDTTVGSPTTNEHDKERR